MRLLSNPIHILELRSYLRDKRFYISFTVSLLLLAGALVLGIFVMFASNFSSDQIGKQLFMVFSVIQYILICLVFPAFSCTSIIMEREKKTLDLLITSDLSPWEIVWGKFLSAFTNAFLFLIATLPIVMISFLFGGVTPFLIVATYGIFLALSCIIIAFCLGISTFYKTTTKAIVGSYVSVLIWGGILSFMLFPALYDYLYGSEILRFFQLIGFFSLNGILTIFICPIFLFIVIITQPFLIATNHLKPNSANRSTSMRIYVFCVFFIITVICCIYFVHNVALNTSNTINVSSIVFHIVLGILLLFAIIVFSSEKSIPNRFVYKRIKKKYSNNPMLKLCGYNKAIFLLTPGSYSGSFFLIWTSFILFAIVYIVTLVTTSWFDKVKFTSNDFSLYGFVNAPLTFLSFICFISMLGCFLSFYIKKVAVRRFILSALIVFLMALPIFIPLSLEIYKKFETNIWNLTCFSPAVGFFSAWANIQYLEAHHRINFFLFGIPLHYAQMAFYFSLAIFLGVICRQKYHKAIKELDSQL